MHAKRLWPLAVLVLALAPAAAAWAISPVAGESAPEFTDGANFVLNAPDGDVNVSTLLGDVVVISATGVR